MLYLVRKLEESIVINNDIELKVVEIKKNSVKLGITFPSTSTILRKEVHELMAKENMHALQFSVENICDEAADLDDYRLEDEGHEASPINKAFSGQAPINS